MSAYPLKAVLDLRRRDEEAAAARLADATRERVVAEAEEARLVEAAVAARARWESARDGGMRGAAEVSPDGGGRRGFKTVVSGAAAADRSRFLARRRDELKRAETALLDFQSGVLARARDAEATARALHLTARQAREALAKHEAKFTAAERKSAERREEETLEDVARASRHPRDGRRP